MFNSNASSAAGDANYIEDVFSTWLYTGAGSSQTITNNIDISGKGGMTWIKCRSAAEPSVVVDTARGASNALRTSSTAASINDSSRVSAFSTSGFTVGSNGETNSGGDTFASWTFRKQPKFFDVVTYTGNGATGKVVSHSLGSVPGCIIIKRTDSTSDWAVYHRMLNGGSGPEDYKIFLNTTAAQASGSPYIISTLDATTFTLGGDGAGGGSTLTNVNGATYVAYLFAHNAGGFGLTGTDNVISCGSFSAPSGDATVTLGYEPQYILWKRTDAVQNWNVYDTMRGWAQAQQAQLYPNLTQAEDMYTGSPYFYPTATGFQLNSSFGLVGDYIYIAIRRGPMKVPTTGTSVFSPLAVNNATGTVNTTNFPIDLQMQFYRPGGIDPGTSQWIDRLRGFSTNSTDSGPRLYTTNTLAEAATAIGTLFNNTGFSTGASWASVSMSYNNFRRAPSFFDEVCYTGTGADPQTVPHNLGAAPELMIFKARAVAAGWRVWGGNMAITEYLALSETSAVVTGSTFFGSTLPTATSFYVGSGLSSAGRTIVAYLFATCAGVSKVGSYTGTGTTQTINCGFTAGARWVMIKRTDSTGDWYVWDSARGIIAGNDPYLLLNSTAAEVTGTDYVDTAATGFELSSTAPAALNANGGTYIFLAIA